MPFSFEVDPQAVYLKFDAIGPGVRELLAQELRPIVDEMVDDARSRAVDHFHSLGAKPGLYLASIHGGVKEQSFRVSGWMRSSNPLAHLLELGFTIRDWMIESKTLMAFELPDIGEVFAREVHRHATKVKPYPALFPAFEALQGEIEDALQRVADRAGEL